MKPVSEWLEAYGESHQNPTNKAIHWICVPLIVLSVVGLLWSIPVPQGFAGVSPWLNWASAALLASVVYYFALSFSLGLGLLGFGVMLMALTAWLDSLPAPLWAISAVIFIGAWLGQFVGHILEGKKPSFFQDLQFLLIGPMWLMSFVYRQLRIPF